MIHYIRRTSCASNTLEKLITLKFNARAFKHNRKTIHIQRNVTQLA